MKNRRLVNCAREFNFDPSLESGADLYESFVSILREHNINFEDVIAEAVKNRHMIKKSKSSGKNSKNYFTKDRFVDALIKASTWEDSSGGIGTIED